MRDRTQRSSVAEVTCPSPLRATELRRQRLGTELRRLRERAGLTATQAAKLLGGNQARMSNIEAGRYGVSAECVRTPACHYECPDHDLVDALAAVTGERKRGWWEAYRDILSSELLDLAELEHHGPGAAHGPHIRAAGTPADHRPRWGPLPAGAAGTPS
jgi:DNA-binding XRE family transcriptional regulator